MSESKKLRVHFENLSSKPPVFHITAQRLAAAKRRHAALLPNLIVSHGEDIPALVRRLPRLDGLVTSFDVITDPAFPRLNLAEAAPKLRWLQLTSAGIEKLLPLDWLPPGIKLVNARGVHRDKANEFAQMALLMLNARVPEIVSNQRAARWESLFTPGIAGRTLCVVGVGNLGQAFARQGKRLGMNVIGVRRSGRAHPSVQRMYPLSKLRAAVSRADFVVAAVPLTGDTRSLIGAAEFAAMRRGVGFINVGRGPVIDTEALIAALRSGHVGNAILDVYPAEPLASGHELWQAPNLVMMPHVAMDDIDRFLPICLDLAFENLKRMLNGRPIRNVVDPKLGY